jgi:hypothetical protein
MIKTYQPQVLTSATEPDTMEISDDMILDLSADELALLVPRQPPPAPPAAAPRPDPRGS